MLRMATKYYSKDKVRTCCIFWWRHFCICNNPCYTINRYTRFTSNPTEITTTKQTLWYVCLVLLFYWVVMISKWILSILINSIYLYSILNICASSKPWVWIFWFHYYYPLEAVYASVNKILVLLWLLEIIICKPYLLISLVAWASFPIVCLQYLWENNTLT